jgi:Lrp/AsnC family transcriptional regulator for asnA, asnC and gidA
MTEGGPNSDEISMEIDNMLSDIAVGEKSSSDQTPSKTGASRPENSTAEKILRILEGDARLSYKEIAERVDVSTPTVRKYIRQLEAKGVILGYSVEINPEKLKQTTVALVEIEIDSDEFNSASQSIIGLDAVTAAHTLRDKSALLIEVQTEGFMEFSTLLSDDIQSTVGVTATQTTILERRHTKSQ